jgi:hypothetical protein
MADLGKFVEDMAKAIEIKDREVSHEKFQDGIGPFEEERQLDFLVEELKSKEYQGIKQEVKYPSSSKKVDLIWKSHQIEAKLLRLRGDNGRLSQYMFRKIFSPFKSNSLIGDAEKLLESDLGGQKALLGIYYEREDEPQEKLNFENISKKIKKDLEFWHSITVEEEYTASFESLRHPVHQKGRVVLFELEGIRSEWLRSDAADL